MTRWFSRFSAVVVVLTIGGWVATAQAQFSPRVIYTLGEGFDLGSDGGAVFGASDTAEWPLGADEDFSADMVNFFPTWSTDTRGPQSEFSMSVTGDEGVQAPFVAWWTGNYWPGAGQFRIGVQGWVKPDPSIENAGVVIPVFTDLVGVYIDEEGRWRYANNTNIHEGNRGTTWDFVDGTGDIARVRYGEWQHVAARTDGSSWDIYVDGTKVSTTNSNNFTYGGSASRAVGTGPDGFGGYVGLIDDFQSFWWDGGPDTFGNFTQFAEELVTGDTNLDGIVDVEDFNIWRMNIGVSTLEFVSGGRIARGDVDFNGVVDLVDFRIIKANRTAGAGGFFVPEPGSLALLGLAAAASLACLRRRAA